MTRFAALPLILFPLLAAPAGAGVAQAAAPAQPDDDDRESLQDLLDRAKRERDLLLTEMGSKVAEVIQELDELSGRNVERSAAKLRRRLLDMGADSAPLLVPHLDPGEDPSSGAKLRGEQIALVLREFASPAVTAPLMEMASKATKRARLNALTALATTPDKELVLPFLRDMYRTATGSLRQSALATLAEIGGPMASELLAEALADKDGEVVDVAIRALGQSQGPEAGASVVAFLKTDAAAEHVEAVLDFYAARPDLGTTDEHILALVALANDNDVSRPDTLRILSALRTLELDLSKDVKQALEPLVDSGSEEIAEATLIVLARAGDKNAKRRLITKYDNEVKKQRDWAAAYEDRAEIYYKIGDYSKAIKDYKEAIELRSNRAREADPFIGIARCYALLGRYKEASEYLDNAPVSMVTLRELAREADFAGMLESKYVRSFHLPK